MKVSAFNKKIEQKIIKFIKEYNLIEPGDRIVVALSGGADSVFLLNFLFKYKSKYKIKLAAFHLNHLLRKDSELDQKFSGNICSQLQVPFFTEKKNVNLFAKKNKISVEEAGRILRYKLLKEISVKNSFNKIATAHNLDDNAETVLLNLIKGKGLRAVSGIPIKNENIIRPILCISKSEIEKYLELNKIEYVRDLSNLSDEFERNYLRLKIVPELTKSINKNLSSTIFQTSRILQDYLDFFESIIEERYNKIVTYKDDDILLNVNLFNKEKIILRSEIIRKILWQELNIEPTFKKINEVISLINSQRGKRLKLSADYEIIKESDFLRFLKTKKPKPVNVKIKIGHYQKIQNLKILIKKTQGISFAENSKFEIIDADKIVGELKIRNWKDGDKFIPLGMRGSKKISDFLTDLKISSTIRKDILVLTDDEKIVSILGWRIDDRVKITENSKNFYKIEIKNGN